jgi:dienelactone hydrolase
MRPLCLCLLAVMTNAADPWNGTVTTTPATSTDLTLTLADGQSATVRVHHPTAATAACPVVIFSHGLAGSKEGYAFLGKRWAEHGYVAIHPDHPGSDTAAFKGKPFAEIPALLRQATRDPQVIEGRPKLIAALITALPTIDERLPGVTLDKDHVGVAGHSFGGWTTLATAGVSSQLLGKSRWQDPRPRAFIALSPPGPSGEPRAGDYAACTRPLLVMTGSNDTQPAFLSKPGAENGPAWRRQSFDLLPAGDKLLAWFEGARHCTYSAGAGNVLSGEPPPDPAQVEAVAVITLAWWDAYLREDAKAKAWLADPVTPTVFGTWAKFERK